ncbi:MAG: DNA mismatch repair endonuclease MutL [Chloroflexi bacterium]|nr:DNA mismatch repair endonuclease MutL [Chloroflexota bacterium]
MAIRVLPPDVVSQIAAGEVIERPASVAKELLENSLDAGATRITIEVAGGGVRLLRVSDNGGGIPPEELEAAFERHATSKISRPEDLQQVSTLGFRGEALPSIAAVAEVALATRPPDHAAGAYIHFRDGKLVSRGSRGCPPGTTVTVRELFKAVPARLKFLKSNATEEGHIAHLVSSLALARPDVAFTLTLEGRPALQSPGSGALRDAAAAVYGHQVAASLLPLGSAPEAGAGSRVRVKGLVSPPSVARASRAQVSLFVNGRWVQNRALVFALEEAYKGMLMTGRHPLAAVMIAVPTEDVDVNVHPTKAQVRFRSEAAVAGAVFREVQRALALQAPVPALAREPAPVGAAAGQAVIAAPYSAPRFQGAPLAGPPAPVAPALPPTSAGPAPRNGERPSGPGTEGPAAGRELPALRVVGQVAETYIVAEGPDGVFLVDQHAAHERILYNQLLEERRGEKVQSQALLASVAVELTPQQARLAESQAENLARSGFLLEGFGPGSCLLRAVPAALRTREPSAALREVLDFMGREEALASWEERAAAAIACHGAVRAGQRLGLEEMRELLGRLEATPGARTCPHGRPTMLHIAASQLEREFGRRG